MQKLIETYLRILGDRIETLVIVMLLGKRTSGKGTLSEILCHLLACYGTHLTISVSGVMDKHIAMYQEDHNYQLGRRLLEQADIRSKGGLLSDEPVTESTFGEIIDFAQLEDGKLILYLDGFPRTVIQARALFAVCKNAIGIYPQISNDEVFIRAIRRTKERAERGEGQRPDDEPIALKRHLESWPKTAQAIETIRAQYPNSICAFDGMSPIRQQIKLALAHMGFKPKEITKIMKPLDDNPAHKAYEIVHRLEGHGDSREILTQRALATERPGEPRWLNFAGPIGEVQSRLRA